MKRPPERIWIIAVILLPVLVLGLYSAAPRPIELAVAWQKARLAEARGSWSQAADAYQVVLDYQPERIELWEKLAALRYSAKDYEKAALAYEQAARLTPISVESFFQWGMAALELERPQETSRIFRLLLDQPEIPLALFPQVVEVQRSLGDYDGALLCALTWLRADPENARAAYLSGALLIQCDSQQAGQILRSVAAGISPESSMAKRLLEALDGAGQTKDSAYGMLLLGQAFADLQEWDLAEQVILQTLTLNNTYAEAWALLGEVRQNNGKDGWPALKTALQLAPQSPVVQTALILYYRRSGDLEAAHQAVRDLIDKYPDQAVWQIELASILEEDGNLIEAMNAYQAGIELEPDNPKYWRLLAGFSARNGFDAVGFSLPAVARAMTLDPHNPATLDTAGYVFLTEGELEEAERFLQQALLLDAGYPPALLHLAQVYLEKGQTSQAYLYLEKAVNQKLDEQVRLLAEKLMEKYFPAQ